jgi:thiol:disulfide interchange protein DsbA
MLLPALSTAADFAEGQHYRRIETPQPTSSPDKVEVVELFWYGCPHCFRLEPTMNRWVAEGMPGNVQFVRMPAVLNPAWTVHARAYYAGEQLGVADRLHEDLFAAIHVQGRRLSTPDSLADFYAEHGVDRDAFMRAFKSFAVDAKLRRAAELGRGYGARGVPAVVVNGKYLTSVSLAGGQQELVEVINHLVVMESQPAS